jgi:hypothetical protein
MTDWWHADPVAASPSGGGEWWHADPVAAPPHEASVPMGGFDAATAADVGKSAGIGVVKGGLGMAGMGGDIVSGFQRGADWAAQKVGLPEGTGQAATNFVKNAVVPYPARVAADYLGIHPPTTEELTHGLESVTGPLYEPKTKLGQYGQNVGEFASGLIGGGEGLASRALTRVLAPAVVSQAAGDVAGTVAKGTALEPYAEPAARVLGAVAAHGAGQGARSSLAEGTRVPTIEDLHEAATNGYNNARGYGVEIRRPHVARLSDDMLSDLASDGFRERNIPKTWSAIEELKDPIGKHVTIDDIESVRKALLRAGSNPLEGAEREASRRAIGAIDKYFETLDPKEVAVNPHFAPKVAQELKDARGNWAAMKGGEAVLDKIEAAERRAGSTYSGTNLDNATRQNIRRFLDNPKLRRQLSADERAQAERIVRGTYIGNTSRFLGKNLRNILGLVVGHSVAGPMGSIAAHGLGHGISEVGNITTRREAEALAKMVRADSPLGRSIQQPTPPVLASPGSYGLSGELARQPGEVERREPLRLTVGPRPDAGVAAPFAKGGAVTPPLSARKESHYASDRGKPGHKCGVCAHYRKPNKCELVGGFIAAGGGCDWFASKRALGGPLEAEERPSTEISMDPSEREENAAAAEMARNVAASRTKQSVKPDMGRGWTGTVDEYLNRKRGAD